jgi:hypothetical protein
LLGPKGRSVIARIPKGAPMTVPADHLADQLGFVLEVDRLKSVLRRG